MIRQTLGVGAALAILMLAASAPLSGQESVPQRLARLDREVSALKQLQQEVSALKADITRVLEHAGPAMAGPRGPVGPRGPTGPRGPAGDSGIKRGSSGDYLTFDRTGGKQVLWLGTSSNLKGALAQLRDSIGSLGVQISGATAAVWVYNKSGDKRVAYVGRSTSGHGLAVFADSSGDVKARVGVSSSGGFVEVDGRTVHDYAEVFELATRQGVSPGTLMSVAREGVALVPSAVAYDRRVVGVVSGAGGFVPGMRIGTREDGTSDLPIAMSGQVYVRVSLEGGNVEPGDLLVASSTPGVAMRAGDRIRAIGAVVGKALERFHGEPGQDEGLIRILVMVR